MALQGVEQPMLTGRSVTDGEGRAWAVGQRLGRGAWASSYLVRAADDRERVLKVPHRAEDFPSDAPIPPALIEACAKATVEQGSLLAGGAHPFLPRLEARFELDDGRPALLLPRYPATLARKLEAGMGLGETLAITLAVTDRLEALAKAGRPHGALRPSNVLLNERGEPVLADLLTPALHGWWRRLQELAPERRDYTPPEADGAPGPGWDTWAACLWVFEAAMRLPDGGDPRHEERLAPPHDGLDKMRLATLKDRALARLKREGANPRFVAKVAERLASLLNRGITRPTEPSPPYRFETAADLRPRLAEVAALVHPHIDDVGRLLLAATARDGVFQGPEEVTFSVAVGATQGLSDHEHIAVGVQVTDLDATDDARVPVPDTRYTVAAHPSGRLRFQFTLPGLPPGRYQARVAFTVRDGGDEPKVAEGEFQVRPPPGYVPPAPEPALQAPTPIRLDDRRREIAEDDEDLPIPVTGATSTDFDVASDADAFPTPIAPSTVPVEPPPRPPIPVIVTPTTTPRTGDPPSVSDLGDVDDELDDDLDDDLDAGDTPTRPSDGVQPPTLQVKPAAPQKPTPVRVAPTPTPGPGAWEDEIPGPEDDLDDWIPGPSEGEDLPGWQAAAPKPPGAGLDLTQLAERVIEIARRDAYAVFLVILAGVLGLVFLFVFIVRTLIPLFF